MSSKGGGGYYEPAAGQEDPLEKAPAELKSSILAVVSRAEAEGKRSAEQLASLRYKLLAWAQDQDTGDKDGSRLGPVLRQAARRRAEATDAQSRTTTPTRQAALLLQARQLEAQAARLLQTSPPAPTPPSDAYQPSSFDEDASWGISAAASAQAQPTAASQDPVAGLFSGISAAIQDTGAKMAQGSKEIGDLVAGAAEAMGMGGAGWAAEEPADVGGGTSGGSGGHGRQVVSHTALRRILAEEMARSEEQEAAARRLEELETGLAPLLSWLLFLLLALQPAHLRLVFLLLAVVYAGLKMAPGRLERRLGFRLGGGWEAEQSQGFLLGLAGLGALRWLLLCPLLRRRVEAPLSLALLLFLLLPQSLGGRLLHRLLSRRFPDQYGLAGPFAPPPPSLATPSLRLP